MKRYDLTVLGGGISGVAAAVSASRQGLSVLLMEKTGHLGGAMSNNLVYPFMRYRTTPKTGDRRILDAGIFTEMRDRFKAYGETSWEFYKLVFDDMIREAGVDVLFHTAAFGVETHGNRIKSLKAASVSGVLEFESDFFIDASGDGDLFYMAGCDYQLGRESDGYSQPMTTCFRLCGVDTELFTKELPGLDKLWAEMQKSGKLTNPRENILSFLGLGDGILHLNTTRVIMKNPTDAFELSEAETEARRQVLETYRFLKENSAACKNAQLIYIAPAVGVRESRKLKGVHVLTAQEITSLTYFEDTVALGNYCIDIHNPTGTGTTIHSFKDEEYYTIPYRSLLPKEYVNLLVAGRCLSATHEAQSAVRIMPICACLGQAAGVAAAIAEKTGTDAHGVDVALLRETLRGLGAVLEL